MIISSVGALIQLLKEQHSEDDTIVYTYWAEGDIEGTGEDWEDVAVELADMGDVIIERGNEVLDEAVTRVKENREES